MTVSARKGLITRGKKQTSWLHSRAVMFVSSVYHPLGTQDAFTCKVTRLPVFLTSVATGVEESGVEGWGIGGVWQWAPGSGLTQECLTQSQPLRSTTVCLQDSTQPSAGSPYTHHHTPYPLPTSLSGCCYNHWQCNKLIRRFTVLITHAWKCCWRFLFGAGLCSQFPLD